jgi:hypothetical protein
MKKTALFAFLAAALGMIPAMAEVDCAKLSLSVKAAVVAEQSKVLEIVSTEVAAAPDCACEIVKSAIEGSSTEVEAVSADTVAAIVEAASIAAPEKMRLVSQCAVAVAPDALAKVQAVVAKLDPNSGEAGASSKSAKQTVAGEVAAMPNPLDFPGQGPVGPTPGGPGGLPIIPIVPPVIINPPQVTDVNP